MGVRLVKYKRPISDDTDDINKSLYHDELLNRDLLNQHPIYAITGLQEALNILEDSINDIYLVINNKNDNLQQQITDNLNSINALDTKLKALEDEIKKIQATKYLDTESIAFTYDTATSSLKANIKVWNKKEGKENTNAVQVLAEGIYVPKFMSRDSNSIIWTEEIKGESLDEIFSQGSRFSHHANSWSDHCYATEENSWYWDDNLKSFVQPLNSTYFNGFITKEVYDCYVHTCTIKSTNGDDDLNGLVIGYIVDTNGNSHTLTALCDRGGVDGNSFSIWYNYQHPNTQKIVSKNLGSRGGWSLVPNGIIFEAKKNKNIVSVCCSRFDDVVLDETMRLDIDLNNYTWGALFCGPVRYGYCNYSQASSFYHNVKFSSTYVATDLEVTASVNLSKDPTNGLSIRNDGLYSEKFQISSELGNILKRNNDGYYVPSNYESTPEVDNANIKEAVQSVWQNIDNDSNYSWLKTT